MLKLFGEYKIESLSSFKDFVAEAREHFQEKQIVLLSGPMGAGKTQFVQFLMESLGGELPMSPTFAIHNSYHLNGKVIQHIDLYRVENDTDLESTGFWEVFDQEEGWIIIEWGDRLERNAYPLDWPILQIDIQPIEDGPSQRQVKIYKS